MILRLLIVSSVSLATGLTMTTTAAADTSRLSASSGTFKVSARGEQSLEWSVNGTRGYCDQQTGTASGYARFSFKSSKPALFYISKDRGVVGSVPTTAKGERGGAFTVTETSCEDFGPAPDFTADASGCGTFKTGIRMDFTTKGSSTWVRGPASPLPAGPCPDYRDNAINSPQEGCGDGSVLHKRSFGMADGGVGLFVSRLPNKPTKSLLKLKKGKKLTITGRARVACNPESEFSNPLTIKGGLDYTLVFKRVD